MRKVIFDTFGELLDSFGEKRTLTQENNKWYCLLTTESYYIFNNVRFFLFKGFGQINYKELPAQKPSFNKIQVRNLDYYLQNGKHSAIMYDEIAQIENFCSMLNFNNSFEHPKIYTKEYNNLLNQLLGNKHGSYTKI